MAGQSGGQRLCLSKLNEQLTCKLCHGYFIDATTIIECLHSFCKSCIVQHLENNKYCPVCNAQVHKNKPLSNIRPDGILQDIVYKVVPLCYQNEMKYRKEFYAKHPEEKINVKSPESLGEPTDSYLYLPEESLSLSLEYYNPEASEEKENDKEEVSEHLPRRYLRCPAAVTVFHLQKLIRAKYGLSEAHRVDIIYKEEPLCGNYTLMDISYIHHWRRKVPLHLNYRIFESASKRLKLSEENDEFKQSLSNNNMEIESKDGEQTAKREWKEVQLKISETGVMSVTDISNLDTKKSTKAKEANQQNSLDQLASNAQNVNKVGSRTEDKESVKSSKASSKGKKAQQDTSKKSEKLKEDKTSSKSQSDSKDEEMEVKSIDQRDLSNELLKNEKSETKSSKMANDSVSTSSDNSSKGQVESIQEKIKTEPVSTTVDKETKNNLSNSSVKPEIVFKQSTKSSSAGSKINALSAKLQFQPKVGQVNNTYSKKSSSTDKKQVLSSPAKITDSKSLKTSVKTEVKEEVTNDSKTSTSASPITIPTYNQSSLSNASTSISAPSGTADAKLSQVSAPSTESLASIGLHVSTTTSNQSSLNSWMTDRTPKTAADKSISATQQLRELGITSLGKDIVFSTTVANPTSSIGAPRFTIQTPNMSVYSITPSSKNNAFSSGTHSYSSSPSKQTTSKPNFDSASIYGIQPCPDAIPIGSLMKHGKTAAKGSTVNEICAKISSGSKINDICAKIGENSKEKNKVPDLLKISKKNNAQTNESVGNSIKHIPNIPNVPIYMPSNSQALPLNDTAKKMPYIVTSQAAIMSQMQQKMPSLKKPSQPTGYKTTRDPPKSWNPTLSKNYVAAKNQAKELQNQSQAAYGLNDGSSVSKQQIPSKPAKIFKIRNMPRYLGNPSSGVKPMFSVANDQQPKDKEQSSASPKNSPSMSMMKIDPQTLSPIVSTPNSPIVSPPPYSTTSARSYQNNPFSRDIRNSTGSSGSSPMSPRNSPVNMFSTSPFIPSPTPNTNPRLIYPHFPPGFADAAGRFSANPLIRSPIGSPQVSSSAFHSSLPPSIKFYQRSSPGYMAQPQTVGQFPPPTSVASNVQPPAIQRVPPSGHASLSSSSSSKTSPKTKSPSANMSMSVPPISSASLVDNVALQLAAKGQALRNLNAFDLTRTENSKSSLDSGIKQPESAHKSSESLKTNTETSGKQNTASSESKSSEQDAKVKSLSNTTKDEDKKEKNLAKLNGGVSVPSNDKFKSTESSTQQQSNKIEKSVEIKSEVSDKSSSKSAVATPETDKTDIKQALHVQQKLGTPDSEKISTQGTKSTTETQKIKTES